MIQDTLHKLYELSDNAVNNEDKNNIDRMIYAIELGIANTIEEAFIKRNSIKL